MKYDELKESELWKLYKENNDVEARNEIVKRYYKQVEGVAEVMAGQFMSNIMVEDLIAFGILGVLAAAKKYDPSKGVKFCTFIRERIRGAMIDSLRNEGWFSRKARIVRKRVLKAQEKLSECGTRFVSYDEIAKEARVPTREVEWLLKNGLSVTSLDEMNPVYENNEEISVAEMVRDVKTPSPPETVETQDLVETTLSKLTEAERKVVEWFYRDGLNIKEISLRLNATRGRVSQLKRDALARARRLNKVGSVDTSRQWHRAAQ
ncbi:MAG: sigma-70 family RNA polymerase sigma factor [Planctomycetota bacterium]|nr:sigma-70 family RNA polymerase sigma factor [Planctomycetota bacterium]